MSRPGIDLEGRSALVTGASRGIGAGIARMLAAAGASVVVSARSTDQIEALASEVENAGGRAWAVPCDVGAPEQITELARRAGELTGGIDILVNNAGIATSAPVTRMALEEWERIMRINVTGVFLCTQAFLPPMVEAGHGRIINIASVAGKMGAAYISAYAASKHAVVGFTRSVAVEVATRGVTVNAVCPGYVDTDMAGQAVHRIVEKTGLGDDDARRSLEQMSPQQRIFEVDEVAFQVLQLCDHRARGVNGQTLVVDGGSVQK